MNLMDEFIQIRLENRKYLKRISSFPLERCLHKEGWTDTAVDRRLIFSHRNTWYEKDTFTEKFHMHEYYELILYIKGDIEYINENTLITPSPYTVVWFKPGQMHTGRLQTPSQYERYVLYFFPEFFEYNNKIVPLTDFIFHSAGTSFSLSKRKATELLELLKKMEQIIQTDKPYAELVLKSLLIEFFYTLSSQETQIQKGEKLTETMAEIKRYMDENYASITSISEVADHFFYSREHLSRKFMQAFNISAANYLARRRINESLALLERMNVTEVAYAVGFHCQSAFINAFKKTMYCLPSEYKSKYKREPAARRQ